MKKLSLIVALAFMPMLVTAQENAFDKFENDAKVTSVVVGKKTFAMLAETEFKSTDAKVAKGRDLLDEVESLKIYTTKDAAAFAELRSAAKAYAKSGNLEDLIQIKDKGQNVSVMVKEGRTENLISQLLIVVDGSQKQKESIVILLSGEFDMDKLSEMVENKTVSGDKQTDEKQFAAVKDALELKLHPNPTSDVFFINTDKPAEVKLYDLSGRLVKTQTYSATGISVAGLQPDTYVAEVTTGDKKQTQKIVVK